VPRSWVYEYKPVGGGKYQLTIRAGGETVTAEFALTKAEVLALAEETADEEKKKRDVKPERIDP